MKNFTFIFLMLLFVNCVKSQTSDNYTATWNANHGWHVFDVCFSTDGKRVLGIEGTVSANSVKYFDAITGELLWSKTVAAIFGRIAPDMSKAFVASNGITAYSLPGGDQAWYRPGFTVRSFDLSSDGSKIAVGANLDGANGIVAVINASTGDVIWQGTTKGPVYSIKFNISGSRVVSGGGDTSDREVILWDAQSGGKLWTTIFANIAKTVNFSPDGSKIIVGTDWQIVKMLNSASGTEIWSQTLTERFNDSGFSYDGLKVFLCQNNGWVRMFDASTGTAIWQTQVGNFVNLERVVLSPDGTKLATGSSDNYLNVLSSSAGTVLFKGLHSNGVKSLNFSYDGTRIVTGTANGGKVTVWQQDGTVNVDNSEIVPTDFKLSQNYPNPFNPSTAIEFNLPYACDVRLDVFNVLGQRIDVLIHGTQQAGIHKVNWNAGRYTSGIYYYSLSAAGIKGEKQLFEIKKMIFLK